MGRGRGAALGAAVLGTALLVSTSVAGARVSSSAVGSSNPSSFAAHDGKIYFVARKTGPGTQIWRSDGTAASLASPLYTVASDARELTWGNTKLYWIAGGTAGQDSLFVSDGVHVPTELALPSGASFTSGLLAVGDLVFFAACTANDDCEPWLSDGTGGGTHPVSDIFPGVRGSYPRNFARFGPFALFAAQDDVHGTELWISGGGGATMVKNFAAGAIDSNPYPMGVVNGRAVVSANDDVHGDELWTTDGNGPNTRLLRDIAPGTNGSSEGAGDSGFLKGRLYFDADDGVHGDELWVTDGTKAGTTLVADIFNGPNSSYPYAFIATTKLLYFLARDKSHGYELWATGGTATSTRLVKELAPGNNVSSSNVRRDSAAARGSTLLFTAYAAGHGYELWSSRGTDDTTAMVKEIRPGSASSNPAHLTRAGTKVYFAADDGVHGLEPWVSDGTKQGTHMIRDLRP